MCCGNLSHIFYDSLIISSQSRRLSKHKGLNIGKDKCVAYCVLVTETALLHSENADVSAAWVGMLISTGYLETTKKPLLYQAYSCTSQPSSALLKSLTALKSENTDKGSELVWLKSYFVCKTLWQLL